MLFSIAVRRSDIFPIVWHSVALSWPGLAFRVTEMYSKFISNSEIKEHNVHFHMWKLFGYLNPMSKLCRKLCSMLFLRRCGAQWGPYKVRLCIYSLHYLYLQRYLHCYQFVFYAIFNPKRESIIDIGQHYSQSFASLSSRGGLSYSILTWLILLVHSVSDQEVTTKIITWLLVI